MRAKIEGSLSSRREASSTGTIFLYLLAVVDTPPLLAPRFRGVRAGIACWLDGIETGWSIPALLLGFVALSTLIFCIACIHGNLHMDVLETWSVGRHLAWGFWKHPPLMGWVAHGWMDIFPLTDWSFRLLALANAGLALFAVDLIARRFVRGDKRAVILFLLLLTPVYQFHAEKFNANSVLLAVWPLATYCFLRSFEERTAGWAAAAGFLCALAMLGKYYSIFLLAGFVVAGILHPDRARYLRSKAPWISLVCGLAGIAPHIYWLWQNDFGPFHYAVEMHIDRKGVHSIKDAAVFALTNAAYLLLPAISLAVMLRSQWREWGRNLRHLSPGLLLLLLIFATSFILPMLLIVMLDSDLPATWHFQGLFFVLLIAVCALRFEIPRVETVNLATMVGGLFLCAFLASPLYALYRNANPNPGGRDFYREASDRLTAAWHEASETPLARVSGDDGLAFATAFYSPDHPVYSRPFAYQRIWGMPRDSTFAKGWSAICFVTDAACDQWMTQIVQKVPRAHRWTFPVQLSLWGIKGANREVAAIIITPLAKPEEDETPAERLDDVGARRR